MSQDVLEGSISCQYFRSVFPLPFLYPVFRFTLSEVAAMVIVACSAFCNLVVVGADSRKFGIHIFQQRLV